MSLKLQMKIESAKAGTGIGKSKQASVPLEQQFSETLSSLSELKVLSLRDTFAEAHMLRAVASMVPQLEKLTRLEIHAVPVHPWLVDIQCSVPAEELREALKKCVWLKDLVLRGVGTVGDTMPRVACELMTSITHITSLESLQLVEGTLSGGLPASLSYYNKILLKSSRYCSLAPFFWVEIGKQCMQVLH